MYVPPRSGAGPSAAHAGSDVTRDVPQLQVTVELLGRGPGAARAPEDAGTRREGNALLHERLRPESRG